jgi:hypothetical protein
VVVALVALATAALLARRWVAQALSQALGTPVAIAALWIGPFADVTLIDVQIGDPGVGPSASRIVIDPDFRRVVRGDWVVNQVAITGLSATLEAGPDGTAAVRGFALPAASEGGPAIDVREVVLRDSDLVGIPPPHLGREPVDLQIARLVARQVPTSAPGVSAFVGTLRGAIDDIPIRGGRRAIEAAVEVGGASIDRQELPLPSGVRNLAGTVSGTATYSLDTGARREEIGADVAISRFRLTTDTGFDIAAERLAAEGVTLDLAAGWRWAARRLEVSDARAAAALGERRIEIAIQRGSLRDVGQGRPGRLEAVAQPPGGGSFAIDGRVGIDPRTADVELRADGVSLPELAAALPPLPLGIARGTASADLRVAGDGERLRLSGTVAASQVHTAPPSADRPEEVLAADRVEARIAYDSAGSPRLAIASLELQYPYAMILRRASGTFPLSALARGTGSEAAGVQDGDATTTPDASPAAPGAGGGGAGPIGGAMGAGSTNGALSVTVEETRIVSGRIDVVDETVTPTYWAGLTSLGASASGVSLPEATVRRLSLTALHDELSPIEASVGIENAGARARIAAQRLLLPSFNPYLSPILGYRAESGLLGLSAEGTLLEGVFSADARLSMKDVAVAQTGLDVVGRETGVPLSVALALVSDYEGEIDLTVPVEADLRSGEIRLGSLVAQAIRKALAAALTSPLRLLGSLFGTEGPPHAFAIDPVPFPTAGGDLDAVGADRVAEIGRILSSHPELLLIAKAQLSAADRAGLAPEEQQALADQRAGAVRAALLRRDGAIVGGVRRAFGALRSGRTEAPPVAESRVIVAPWQATENPSGDPLSGVYVELQAR